MKKILLSLIVLALCPLLSYGQGIPYIRNYSSTEYKAHNQNFDVFTGKNGIVYFANFEGLLYYDQSQWRIIYTPGVTRITAIFRDSKGTIWTGGYNYIGKLATGNQGQLILQGIDHKNVFSGEVQWIWEKAGHIYFLVSDRNIYTVDNKKIRLAADEKIPEKGKSVFHPTAHINQVQELENGQKALVASSEGIIIVDAKGNELMRINETNGLCSNNVAYITYDHHGTIWGATDNGVFAISYPSPYTHFTPNEGLRGGVLSMCMKDGQMYVGTLSGLFLLQGNIFKPIPQISYACWQLAVQGNSILAGTSNGVYRITADGNVRQLTTANTLSLLVDGEQFYSGEIDGMYLNHSNGKREKVNDIDKVTRIMRDNDNKIWMQNLYGKLWCDMKPYTATDENNDEEIGTLVKYQGEVLPIFATTTMPFRYPLMSYEDPMGILWLNNNKGRHLYAMRDGKTDSYLSSAVQPLQDYSFRAMYRRDKSLWLGSDKSLCVVNLIDYDARKDHLKTSLFIRSVTLNGDSILWGGMGNKPAISVKSNENHITIYYSTDYPQLIQRMYYRTRLNGGQWSTWDSDTFEEYPNLTHGDYTFEVQARDAFGHMTDIDSISFTIRPPFYLRWWMLLLYFIIAGIVIHLFLQWRTRQLEKDKHRLETLVKERTTEVVRLEKAASVGKLTQGLIDRILNPLNYINNFAKLSQGLVEDIKANIEDDKERMTPDNYDDTMDVLSMLKGNLEKVEVHGANTSRTLKSMEEMMKDHTGVMSDMSLSALLQQNRTMIERYFEKEISEHNIRLVYHAPSEDIHIQGNAEQLNKTFMSILGNAVYAVVKKDQRIKAAGQRDKSTEDYQPEVMLELERRGDFCQIRVRDNGTGIEQNILEKIFDPFFTTKTTSEASGIGLYLSREIVQNHGGTINVASEKNVYTEFTIEIKTRNQGTNNK